MLRLRAVSVVPVGFLLVTLAACSKKPARTESDEIAALPPKVELTMPKSAPEPVLPPGQISRKSVDTVLARGPSWVLAHVSVDPVERQNNFVGWKLQTFPSEWDGSGLRPGDVVTRVNGRVPKTEDDYYDVWSKLPVAEEIRVAYLRDGQANEAVFKIVGAPNPDFKKEAQDASPVSAKAAAVAPKETTTVITDETGQPDPESTEY